jgi:hypothetical protein
MDRRQLLRAGGFTLAVSACPAWIANAFAQEADNAPKRDELEPALACAAALGKPLLVLPVPDAQGERWTRGNQLGLLLRFASQELLAALALTEVACIGVADMHKRFATLNGSPQAVLIELESSLPVVPIAVDLGAQPDEGEDEPDTSARLMRRIPYPPTHEKARKALERWIEPLATALRSAIVADVACLARRERIARTSLDSEMAAAVDGNIRHAVPTSTNRVDRAAALYFSAMRKSDTAHELWAPLLADAARIRLCDTAPSGARWANHTGCGINVEGEPKIYVSSGPCGTGALPPLSRRFLWFLTENDR